MIRNTTSFSKKNNILVNYDSSTDSESGRWDFSFLEISDEEIFDEGKRLTSLVRNSYVGHIERLLAENCKLWLRTSNSSEAFSSHRITRCAKQLEEKALRTCMMANIYQRKMLEIMREIKKSTCRYNLFKELTLERYPSEPKCLSKETQTESSIPKEGVITHHVTKNVTNFSDFPVPNGIKEDIKKVPLFKNKNELSSPLNLPIKNISSNYAFDSSEGNSMISDLESMMNANSASIEAFHKSAQRNNNICGAKRKFSSVDVSCDKNESIPVKKNVKTVENLFNFKDDSFYNRIVSLENLFGEADVEDSEQDTDKQSFLTQRGRPQIFVWHVELSAQMCQLNNILLSLSMRKRYQVEKRFKDLFGCEKEPVTDISGSEIGLCRKRIADLVVSELTQFYNSCRIGSRFIFKQLAKKITDTLLQNTYCPDLAEVRKSVQSVFENGKSIMTEEDLKY